MKNHLLISFIFISCFAISAEKKATFAGGCFWCMESPFEKLVGVKEVISGYSGGKLKNPSYEKVSSGQTQHRETVQIIYNDELVSYKRLLEIYWQNIDPTDDQGQFVDRGHQYSPAIYFHDQKQREKAESSLKKLVKLNKFIKDIKTPILKYSTFYPAEDYHQDYYRKNLLTIAKYKYYRSASGRDDFIKQYWKEGELFLTESDFKKPSRSQLKKILTETQYAVTQKDDTETAFKNKYWDNKKEGLYVDIVSGEALFSSKDKFKSGTGWPSFTKPINPDQIIEKVDSSFGVSRVEIRSRVGNSHLGHVFKDGPKPTGMRYCINSAALKFIPKSELKEKGYHKYLSHF